MADDLHLATLRSGALAWHAWREANPGIQPDLSDADLRNMDLREANLKGANLRGANLSGANLTRANLEGVTLESARLAGAVHAGASITDAFASRADFSHANLQHAFLMRSGFHRTNFADADLSGAWLKESSLNYADFQRATLVKAELVDAYAGGANFREANLEKANLWGINLGAANLSHANLTGSNLHLATLYNTDLSHARIIDVDLTSASLVQCKLHHATLRGCQVYGVSVWQVDLDGAAQADLVITPTGTSTIAVDNLEVAQFIYLLLHSDKIRHAIDTITSKVVLILGRFTPERKAILDAIRSELQKSAYGYVPVVFDFDRPASRDTHETVTTLARMARFVIADITDPKSIPQELVAIVEQLPSLPVQPILHRGGEPWGMYDHIRRYPWVLEIHRYDGAADLVASLREQVIDPVEAKVKEMRPK